MEKLLSAYFNEFQIEGALCCADGADRPRGKCPGHPFCYPQQVHEVTLSAQPNNNFNNDKPCKSIPKKCVVCCITTEIFHVLVLTTFDCIRPRGLILGLGLSNWSGQLFLPTFTNIILCGREKTQVRGSLIEQ